MMNVEKNVMRVMILRDVFSYERNRPC